MNNLTPEEHHILEEKGTEAPFTGDYDSFFNTGTYICRRCNNPLYTSEAKFDAGCGWPAFDGTLPNSVVSLLDDDGDRTEIQCAHCGGHLGHVFHGEQLTKTNIRHCVNSLSMRFIPMGQTLPVVLDEEDEKLA